MWLVFLLLTNQVNSDKSCGINQRAQPRNEVSNGLTSTTVMAGRAPVRNRSCSWRLPPNTRHKLSIYTSRQSRRNLIETEYLNNGHFTFIDGKMMQLRCTLVANHGLTAVHYIQCAPQHCRMVPMSFLLYCYPILICSGADSSSRNSLSRLTCTCCELWNFPLTIKVAWNYAGHYSAKWSISTPFLLANACPDTALQDGSHVVFAVPLCNISTNCTK